MSGLNAVLARNTEKAPKGIGGAAQTVAFSHYNHLSAQLPINVATGELVAGGLKEQAVQSFENLKTVIESIDKRMDDVVRLTVFVTEVLDLPIVDTIFASYFPTYRPARTVVAVQNLPKGALIQVEAVVSHGHGTIPNEPQAGDLIKLTNETANAPRNGLSSQTVSFSHYNNVTAQLPIDPETGRLVVGGVKEQTLQALKNVKAILAAIDVPFDDIVKVNVYVTNLADVDAVNEVYLTQFPDSGIARAVGYLPARTIIPVKALELEAAVQVEVVVSHGDGTPPQAIEDRHGLIIEATNAQNTPAIENATHSVAFSHYNNISGQLPVDAKTGELVSSDVKEQTTQVFTYIKNIIESVDHVMEDIVKLNVFLTDLNDLSTIEAVYADFFPEHTAAMRVVEVAELPKGARVQIDAVAGNAEGTPPVA